MTEPAWRQCNLGLGGDAADRAATARALFAQLGPILEPPAGSGAGPRWFFQRKPPDVRLRICVTDAEGQGAEVANLVDRARPELEALGLVHEAWWSDYPAEVERFGGPAALDRAHTHFHRNTRLWCRVDQALARSTDPVTLRHRVDVAFVAVASALVERHVPDAAARPRVWQALAALTNQAGIEPRPLLTPDEHHDVAAHLREWLGADIELLTSDPGTTTDGAAPADDGPDTTIGLADSVALLVHFDANRWGVDGTGQRWMARQLGATPLDLAGLRP